MCNIFSNRIIIENREQLNDLLSEVNSGDVRMEHHYMFNHQLEVRLKIQ